MIRLMLALCWITKAIKMQKIGIINNIDLLTLLKLHNPFRDERAGKQKLSKFAVSFLEV